MSGETDSSFESLLENGETLIWKGPIGFNFISSTVFVFAMYLFAGYVFWAIWGSYTLEEFCPPAEKVSKCGSVYILIPPLLLLMAMSQSFDMLERRALDAGTAHGAVLLTDRRIIRVSDWPWHRIRAYDYRSAPPRRGLGGVIRFGTFGSVCLSPKDAAYVHEFMRSAGQSTP